MTANSPGYTAPPWDARRILFATLAILGVVVVFVLLYRFYMVVFLFFIAFSLKVALDPAVMWLKRRGVRREVSLIGLYTSLAVLVLLLVWTVAPPLIEQTQTIASQLPDIYTSLRNSLIAQPTGLVRGVGLALPTELSIPDMVALAPRGDPTEKIDPWATPLTMTRIFLAFVSVFVMAYFWTMEGEQIIRRFLLRVPVARREGVRSVINEIQGKINGYFRGQLLLCTSIWIASTAAFFLIGLPNPFLLGLLMGLFEVVPIVGPVLGAIPALLMAASSSPDKVPWVLGAVVLIQVAESNLLVPRVMDKAVGVNAIVSLLALTAFGALFGFAGALMAVPLAAVLQILFSRLLFDNQTGAPSSSSMQASSVPHRHQWAVMQLQAQALAQDARRLARTYDEANNSRAEQVLDEIEVIAHRLDQYLAEQETRI